MKKFKDLPGCRGVSSKEAAGVRGGNLTACPANLALLLLPDEAAPDGIELSCLGGNGPVFPA